MTTDHTIDLHFTYRVTDPARFEDYLDIALPLTQDEEPYVLEYSLARNSDGIVLQHERYENEAAIAKHLEVTAEGQKAWNEATELLDIRFVGPLSDEFFSQWEVPENSRWGRYRSIQR